MNMLVSLSKDELAFIDVALPKMDDTERVMIDMGFEYDLQWRTIAVFEEKNEEMPTTPKVEWGLKKQRTRYIYE